MGPGLIGAKANTGATELKLELMPNDLKLEGSKNYLIWSRKKSACDSRRQGGGTLFRGDLC